MSKNKYNGDMKKQINDLLLKMQNGENCIGETANQLLNLYNVRSILPPSELIALEVYYDKICKTRSGCGKERHYYADDMRGKLRRVIDEIAKNYT